MGRKFWIGILSLLYLPLSAQQGNELTGKTVDQVTGEPISGVVVILRKHNLTTQTDVEGKFVFRDLRPGDDAVALNAADFISTEIPVRIPAAAAKTDLGMISLTRKQLGESMSLVGVIDELDLAADNDGGISQDVSTMVIFSNDVFLNNAGYQFSPFRFRIRGYENRYEEKYINGVNFNDQIRGVFSYASIGALNDITRNGDAVNYFSPSAFSFGNIGGTENINMRPGSYARGGKLTVSYTNRNYYLRGMASYSTGMQDNGWAVTASLGGRYSDEGNVDGIFYRNISYAFGVEKTFDNGRQSISFITFGSPVERGQQMASVQEAYNLTGDNLYNPNWGYQNGKKRNARVVKSFDPTAILSHVWNINELNTLNSGIGIHYNRYGRTAMNWYNGPDPRPDYYRYLPSYHKDNELAEQYYTYLWKSKQIAQIDWDAMWEANHINNISGNGAAIYMVEEQRQDLFELAFNSTLNSQLSDRIRLTAGIGAKRSISMQFKTVDDLLGAKYILDIDKFAERDFPGESDLVQNDLERPGRRAYKDDVFGYDFRYLINSADIWMQQTIKNRTVDLYYGAKLKYTDFQRDGNMRNGRYPDNSFGKGALHRFIDLGFKGGVTYKANGRHFFSGNVSYQTVAPLVESAYISPRITDRTTSEMKSIGIFSADLSYIFSLPSLNGRISVFNTNFFNDTKRISYYVDTERTFVNHLIKGINKVHRGFELGTNFKLDNNWNFDLAGTVSEYYYSNNPAGIMSYENGKNKESEVEEISYMKNCYVGGTPQFIGTLGINYFNNYWFINLNINGFGRNYVEAAPIRRLASIFSGVVPPGYNGYDEALYKAYREITTQERFGSGYTVDLSIGKIFYLPNRKAFNFNLSVNNLLNREHIRTGGYEQGRNLLEYAERFPNKYYYMQGINCFLNMSYRF